MDQQSKTNLPKNPQATANILSILFFWWLNPFLRLGYKKDLEVTDLYQILPEDSSKTLGETLEREWIRELQKATKNVKGEKPKKPSFYRALRRCFAWDFMKPGILAFIEECGLRVIQPVCLGQLVKSFQPDTSIQKWEAYLYGTGVVLSSAFYIFTHHPYFHGVQHVGMKLRVASCSLIYRKCLRLSKSALGQTTVGQMVNLLSNDVNRFDYSVLFVHYLWVGPIQTAIILGILWYELGPSCLAGLILLVLYIPFQGWIGKVFSEMRLKTATRTDERIRIMNEIISGMRVIKMYTWEKPFASLIELCRKKEVEVIKKTSYYRALNMSLFYTSSKVILFVTFLIYVLTGNVLTAEKVFVALALYNNLRLVMTLFFPSAISLAAETMVSIERLQKFLLLDEKETLGKEFVRPPLADCCINLTNATAKWLKEADEPTLSNISCSVKPGQLLAVVGPVGSGKSSLLHVLLQELPLIGGGLSVKGKVAYASQEPWVFSGTVRQNILCGQNYDPKRYQQVLRACALDKDLALLPHSDRTHVGEKGVSLSGGQKARVNLARALYLDADIYLLDDPLSAVDTHVGRHLFDRSIMGFLKDKIRVLVTHQVQYLREADHILVLKQGAVEGIGTYSDLQTKGIDIAKLVSTREEADDEKPVEGNWSRRPSESQGSLRQRMNSASLSHRSVSVSSEKEEEAAPVQEEEIRSKGSVSAKVYADYFKAGGGWFAAVMLVLLNIVTQICFSGSDYWLTIWTNGEERRALRLEAFHNHTSESLLDGLAPVYQFDNVSLSTSTITTPINQTLIPGEQSITAGFLQEVDTYVGIYVYTGIVGGLFVFSMLRTILFFLVCMKASVNLHNTMFSAVIRTPVRFFDVNPVGRTLNRFSKDIGTMDEMLPTTMFDVITIFLSIFGVCIVVGLVNPWLLLPCVVLGVVFHYFRVYYLCTARDVKRLEGVTRSPVFSHLSASLVGLTTVRAHGAEEVFQIEFDLHQDLHSSAWYLFMTTARWFGIWLDWICVFYLAFVTYGCLVMTEMTTSSDAGLVVSSAMGIMGAFQWGVRQSTEVENQMTSAERVMEYSKLPPEAPLESSPGKRPPGDWPTRGEIKFENMTLRYSEYDPPVLRNITCTVRPKEKVGIVGRTGAGKSSLIAALFRMTEPEGVIRIDGIISKEIGLHDLRSRLSIIPQDPVLFTGTLRRNLDPFGEFADESLWKVLEEVKLKDVAADLPQGLDYQVAEGGSNFSVGQRQLVCLARAILRQNRILVLDEATANVDPKTDELIQETIREKFQHCTVLTIAHRLNTIMDSDRVMVMDAGLLKEFDEPSALLETKTSLFYSLVEQTGKDEAQHLKDVAKQAAVKRSTAVRSTTSLSNIHEESIPQEFVLRAPLAISEELTDSRTEIMPSDHVAGKEEEAEQEEITRV